MLRWTCYSLIRRIGASSSSMSGVYHKRMLSSVRDEMKVLLANDDKRIVVLDDDPTGCQTVHDVTVLLDYDINSLREQLLLDEKCFYVLTNSRSMTEQAAVGVNSRVLSNIQEACKMINYDKPISYISRGDSCLRGHYPAEVDTIKQFMIKDNNASLSEVNNNLVTVLIPAFIEGGRITKDSIHYVKEEDRLIPVGDTPFAKDPHFSFTSSNLRDYVIEKSNGQITDNQIKSITLSDMRDEEKGIDHIKSLLRSCSNDDVVVVDVEKSLDMDVFITALLQCEKEGKQQFVYRTAASFVASRCGIENKQLLSRSEMTYECQNDAEKFPQTRGGLVVVGSYVPKTTSQLKSMCEKLDIHEIEFDVELFRALISVSPQLVSAMTTSISKQINHLILSGKHVVLYTSRREMQHSGKSEDAISDFTAVSDALTSVVAGLEAPPLFLIAKGGITSHDVAHKGLQVSKARVVGQVAVGVPVWKTLPGSKFPGMHYVVFPGNVGDTDTLAQVAAKLGVSKRNITESPEECDVNTKQKNKTMKILTGARENGQAIAAFNVYNLEGAKAVVQAAHEQKMPILIQVHPSSLEFGGRELLVMLCTIRDNSSIPVGVHLDHSVREDDIRLALECGVDSIMVDGSHLPLNENIEFTKRMTALAHQKGIVVEAELGRLAGEEDGLSISEKEAKMTDPEVVQHFLRETEVDLLAVTIGNVHGKYKHKPCLDFDRLEAIRQETIKAANGESPCLLVLHGASGLPEDLIKRAINGGVCKFNVNTDVRNAAMSCLQQAFDNSDETELDVLPLMKKTCDAMKEAAKKKIKSFCIINN